MTEADTCRKFVVPLLQKAGWDDDPHPIAGQIRNPAKLEALRARADALSRNNSVGKAVTIWK